jgi:YD repeat-containing protein
MDSVIVPVPAGATTGPVAITAGGVASNTYNFTVSAGISSISPTAGGVGASVAISGTGFGTAQGNSRVTFNGVAATPTSWSDTGLVVTAPAGATTGTVAVQVNGVSAVGPVFTVTAGSLTGNVQDSNGNPINGVSIQLLQSNRVVASTASANGAYTIANLPAGSYDLRASASGYGTSIVAGINVSPSGAATANVTLGAAGTVAGTVTQSDGATPVSGANVTLFQELDNVGSSVTDSSGSYSISSVGAGTYTLQASAFGYGGQSQAGVVVTVGQTSVVNVSLSNQPVITYTYDALGRLVQVSDSVNGTAVYSYDAVGNILSITRLPPQ